MTFREHMKTNQNAPYCSICHQKVTGCSKQARACICSRCCCETTEVPERHRS